MLLPPSVQPEVVELVRQARGLTQSALALRANLSQGFVSKVEAGDQEVDIERLVRLAAALDCPVALLTTPASGLTSPDSPCDFFRRRATTPVAVVKQARGMLGVAQIQVQRLLGDSSTDLLRTSPTADGFIGSAEIAREARQHAGLPAGPVDDVVHVLESMGVIVIMAELPTKQVDALSHRPHDGVPLIMLNRHAPGDRLRHSAAHEAGHLIMHDEPINDQEREADTFAAEFLMPASDIRADLRGLSLERLAKLKAVWRVSMAALLRRGYSLGQVTERQYRDLNIELSKAGYRTREPVNVDQEKPERLLATVDALVASGRSFESVAEQALVSPTQLAKLIGGYHETLC